MAEKKSEKPEESVGEELELAVIENPLAPILTVDGFAGVMVRDHAIKINLTALQTPHARAPNSRVAQEIIIARLAMSTSAFARTFHALSESVKKMQNDGVIPIFDPKTDTFEWRAPKKTGVRKK